MKLLRRFNTVLYQLFVSYAVLIILTTLIVGLASYLFFTANFNQEVEKMHRGTVIHTGELLDHNVFRKTESMYMDLAMNADISFLFQHAIAGNHANILRAKRVLEQKMNAYPDLVQSISIYYRNHDVLLSSHGGITYLNGESRSDLFHHDVMTTLEQPGSSERWIGRESGEREYTVLSAGHDPLKVVYARTYPILLKTGEMQGYIAIVLNNSVITDMIRSTASDEHVLLFIMDHSGRVISIGDSSRRFTAEQEEVFRKKVMASELSWGTFTESINGVRSVISYAALPTTGWRLIGMTPVEQFYEKSSIIQRTLIVICLLAIAVGIGISYFFIAKLYNPLNKVVQSLRSMLGARFAPPHDHSFNEYVLINEAISGLSEKVGKLEATVEDNVPLIEHHLIVGLLHNTVHTEQEFREKLAYLQIEMTEPYYTVVIIEMDERQLNELSVQNKQIILYNLIRELEDWEHPHLSCLAASSSDRHIAVVVNTGRRDEEALRGLATYCFDYALRNFRLQLSGAAGGWSDNPLQLHQSFREAGQYLAYKYFMPLTDWFPDSMYRSRQHSREEIPEQHLDALHIALKHKDMDAVRASIDSFVQVCEQDRYSLEHCEQRWRDMVGIYHKYVKDVQLTSSELITGQYVEQFDQVKDIHQFRQWLLDVIALTFRYMDERNLNKTNDMVDKARKYCEEHLAMSLSLSEVAEHVGISPGYLSQLFKELTGTNFVDYVTGLRLEKASELVVGTGLTIEQIAQQVGYNSPTYFIKKFKGSYGVTPKVYRYHHSLRQQQ
ncbi:helix-turn-helix domain-containing protein [Paenibacillus sp. J5C_2022]|uniref:helix-turn-helix domain-containing protein n=1 Tax=Paenibacillus sp. J5C2022 TaxID=2977129 RepID=UPI0021CF61CE|nr:helix-turn-helix domain-containing protein [Paenibacillus sp. J5C2022]MCU6708700.1 helix-turn-helix domain-containing protein [Paenibacillus sp. J5C2022]